MAGVVAALSVVSDLAQAAWLRDWLYHGLHLLYGVRNLSAGLRTLPAIACSHELPEWMDPCAFFFIYICPAFPLIALALTDWSLYLGRRCGGPQRPSARWRGPSPVRDPGPCLGAGGDCPGICSPGS